MKDASVYKQKLTNDLQRLTGDLRALGVHNPENPRDWIAIPERGTGPEPDPNDAADRVEAWDERAATLAPLEREYNDIIRALKNIEYDTYGTCEVCGTKIEPDRLDAHPAARTCKCHLDDEATLTR